MRDTTGEAEQGGLKIPVVMVPKSTGETLLNILKDGGECELCLRVHAMDACCAICQDEYALNESIIRLPCRHIFHEACVLKWLEKHRTCPMCRYEFRSIGFSSNESGRGHISAENIQNETWRAWFT